jgi:hypothetical protein
MPGRHIGNANVAIFAGHSIRVRNADSGATLLSEGSSSHTVVDAFPTGAGFAIAWQEDSSGSITVKVYAPNGSYLRSI